MINQLYSLVQGYPVLMLVIYWIPFILSLIFIKIYNKSYPYAYRMLKNNSSAKPLVYSLSFYGLFSYLLMMVGIILGGFMTFLMILK